MEVERRWVKGKDSSLEGKDQTSVALYLKWTQG